MKRVVRNHPGRPRLSSSSPKENGISRKSTLSLSLSGALFCSWLEGAMARRKRRKQKKKKKYHPTTTTIQTVFPKKKLNRSGDLITRNRRELKRYTRVSPKKKGGEGESSSPDQLCDLFGGIYYFLAENFTTTTKKDSGNFGSQKTRGTEKMVGGGGGGGGGDEEFALHKEEAPTNKRRRKCASGG